MNEKLIILIGWSGVNMQERLDLDLNIDWIYNGA